MRRLSHLLMSPVSRLARLALTEKRIPIELVPAEDPLAHLPVLIDLDGRSITGLWAIIDYLEGSYPEPSLFPADAVERAEALRLLDLALTQFHEEVTKRIVFQKAPQAHTGSFTRMPVDMPALRIARNALRSALKVLGELADANGYLASREISLADLAFAAHLSALDYFGEVPWAEFPSLMDWYLRMKSRPAFRTLLGDRVPGQPPAAHYAILDF